MTAAAAAVERAAVAQAMLRGLGVTPEDLAPGAPALDATGADDAAIDVGLLARTALVRALLAPAGKTAPGPFRPLEAKDVKAYEANLRTTPKGPPKLLAPLAKRARALLETAAAGGAKPAVEAVATRWIAGLAPLEPVLVAKPPAAKPARRRKV